MLDCWCCSWDRSTSHDASSVATLVWAVRAPTGPAPPSSHQTSLLPARGAIPNHPAAREPTGQFPRGPKSPFHMQPGLIHRRMQLSKRNVLPLAGRKHFRSRTFMRSLGYPRGLRNAQGPCLLVCCIFTTPFIRPVRTESHKMLTNAPKYSHLQHDRLPASTDAHPSMTIRLGLDGLAVRLL